MKLRDAFLVFSNLLFSFALKMGVTKACSYDPGNWAGVSECRPGHFGARGGGLGGRSLKQK